MELMARRPRITRLGRPGRPLDQNPNMPQTPPGTLSLGTFAPDWMIYAVKVKRL